MQLAELNEQQSKAALENLAQRVQLVASEISGDNKGNEFIAALQSGLKEFKQQLAQGHEPAIDLKAIVAEALAQISGESLKGQQPKIDASVSQFNAVLNQANVINSAAMHQQAQASGVSEAQLTNEFNIAQLEGTKLANSIQSQLNAQASADKAINIFKQEGQQQLAEKVRWMVNAKNAVAEIRLDPPDLGGINIKINLSGDVAQVNFNVQSQAAKDALDAAAPRLREMLEEQGIELGQSSVQQDSQGSQQDGQNGESPTNGSSSMANTSNDSRESAIGTGAQSDMKNMNEQRITNGAIGGIDYYA